MTTTLTTSKGTHLVIGVQKNYGVTIIPQRGSATIKLLCIDLGFPTGSKCIELGEGDYEIIIPSVVNATEDQAREVVDPFIVNYRLIGFNDYVTPTRYTNTAIDSLRSLMQAERLYTSNIYTQPDADSSREHTDAYNEMQSRTFPDWLIIKVK